MSLRQMEYLVTVVEQSSFTRAAEVLNVTQSALSHQIKALEREVGGPLLERLPRGVRPTAMGRAYLPDAELAVRSARQARRAARAAAGAGGGELHLATLHGLAVGQLAATIGQLRRDHPELRIVLMEFTTEYELAERMERGVADLAVGYEPPRWSGPTRTVGEERYVLLVPPGDPLADSPAPVPMAALAERDWVRCQMEPLIDGVPFLDWACGQFGYVPRTVVRTAQSSTAVRMAAEGAGVLLAPEVLVRAVTGRPGLLTEPAWRRPLVVYGRTRLSPAAVTFVERLERDLAEPGGRTSRSAAPKSRAEAAG